MQAAFYFNKFCFAAEGLLLCALVEFHKQVGNLFVGLDRTVEVTVIRHELLGVVNGVILHNFSISRIET